MMMTLTTMMMIRMRMRMRMLARPMMMRCLLDVLTFCHSWQKGGGSFDIKVVIYIRGELA